MMVLAARQPVPRSKLFDPSRALINNRATQPPCGCSQEACWNGDSVPLQQYQGDTPMLVSAFHWPILAAGCLVLKSGSLMRPARRTRVGNARRQPDHARLMAVLPLVPKEAIIQRAQVVLALGQQALALETTVIENEVHFPQAVVEAFKPVTELRFRSKPEPVCFSTHVRYEDGIDGAMVLVREAARP